MASTHEPLISSPIKNTNSNTLSCKALSLTLFVASLICLATFMTHHPSTTYHSNIPFRPSDLCTGSPSPLSCHAIVAGAIATAQPQTSEPHPIQILQTLINQSLVELHKTSIVAATTHHQHHNLLRSLALTDCVELLDLSHDRLKDSATAIETGAHADARTWLSAVLTNYATCLDELTEQSSLPVRDHLNSLSALASASLAVLNAVSPHHDDAPELAVRFPSWVTIKDRKILEISSTTGINVNVVVAKDGSGDYSRVQDAVNSAPDKSTDRYVIYVKTGTYAENVVVGKKKTNVMIIGDGMNATTITGSLNVVDNTTTFNSATLAAVADGFILQDICIENTAGPQKHQAVALRVGADKSVINRCQINAYQDTLYAHSLRQFYRDSYISGTVDFIFGNAAVVFQNCTLVARLPMQFQQNLVTAQGRMDPNQNTGTSIQSCKVIPSPELVPMEASIPTYLGRPWKNYSRTVYMQSYIDSHINPAGWLPWDGDFGLDTLYYGEYANTGPGAGVAGRVNWTGYHVITDPAIANNFTVAQLIQGGVWLQSTGVTFTEGL